jgi:thioredoxin 1
MQSAPAAPTAATTVPAPEVTDATFADEVLAAEGPVLVDFWAPWCRPCKAIEPILEQLTSSAEGRVALVRLNVDENPGVPSRHGVLSLPTVILFEGGEARATVVGARPRSHFERAFAEWLEPPTPMRGSSSG